jgi:hypothetical protein
MFPYCDPKDRNDPAMKQKIKDGPWGTMSLMAKPWSMGQMLGLWLVNLLIISTLIGYIGANTLPAGTAFAHVTRIVGTAALLAYGGSSLTDSIWKGRPWSVMPGVVFDAVVYAAVTAVVFGLLWPKGM